jgi:hypothetical protein
LFADRYALEHGKPPGVRAARAAVGGAQKSASEALRAYKAGPPAFARTPSGGVTSLDALTTRCFRAFDDAEESITPGLAAHLDASQREQIAWDALRALHQQLSAADVLLTRLDQLTPSLGTAVLALARSALGNVSRVRGALHHFVQVDAELPEQTASVGERVWTFFKVWEDDDAEPAERPIPELQRQINQVAVDLALEGKALHVYHADHGWVDYTAGAAHVCASPRGQSPPLHPGGNWLQTLAATQQHAADGFEQHFSEGPRLTVGQAAEIAGISSRALIERIRRREDAGEPHPFHFDKSASGEWRIATGWTTWRTFAGWMRAWEGRSAPRRGKARTTQDEGGARLR